MTSDSTIEDKLFRFRALVRASGPIALCAVAGFLSAFTVSFVGLMPVGELILMLVCPWVLVLAFIRRGWPTRFQTLSWYKILFVLVGVMALGYVGSDLYRGTANSNLVRGWARVGFLAIDLMSIAYLIDGSWRRLYVFVLALCLGGSVNALLTGPLNDAWWKFGFGYTVTAIGLFVIAGRIPLLQVIVGALLGVLSMSLGARSLGSICFLVAGLFWLRYARGVFRPLAFVLMLGALAGMFLAANAVFIENQNHAGSNMERQSMIETAVEAFISSPMVGQGSWFTAARISRLEERLNRKDPTFRGYTEEEARKISIHSQLLVSLAEGGILGGVFFIFMGLLLLKTLRTLINNPMPHRAFLLYLVIAGLWNLCMTPFSGVTRIEIVLAICACLMTVLQQQGELTEDYRE